MTVDLNIKIIKRAGENLSQVETKYKSLKKIHIGLMPLHDDDWSNGKCGFKALQYMSIGMPAIVNFQEKKLTPFVKVSLN
jgi:hypothetical protein